MQGITDPKNEVTDTDSGAPNAPASPGPFIREPDAEPTPALELLLGRQHAPKTSERNARAIEKRLRYWCDWYIRRLGQLPTAQLSLEDSETALVLFIRDHMDIGIFSAVIKTSPEELVNAQAIQTDTAVYVYALGHRQDLELPSPSTLEVWLWQLMSNGATQLNPDCFSCKRVQAHKSTNRRESKAPPKRFSPQDISDRDAIRIASQLGTSLLGLRDHAALLCYQAIGRCAIWKLKVEHLALHQDGSYSVNVIDSGLAMNRRPSRLRDVLSGKAAEALTRWLSAAEILEGYVFVRISRFGGLYQTASGAGPVGLTAQAQLSALVKKLCDDAGLDGRFTARSLPGISEDVPQNVSKSPKPESWS